MTTTEITTESPRIIRCGWPASEPASGVWWLNADGTELHEQPMHGDTPGSEPGLPLGSTPHGFEAAVELLASWLRGLHGEVGLTRSDSGWGHGFDWPLVARLLLLGPGTYSLEALGAAGRNPEDVWWSALGYADYIGNGDTVTLTAIDGYPRKGLAQTVIDNALTTLREAVL